MQIYFPMQVLCCYPSC